jgi:hypothetical protein
MDAAVLYGLDRIGELDQLAGRGFRVGVGASLGEFTSEGVCITDECDLKISRSLYELIIEFWTPEGNVLCFFGSIELDRIAVAGGINQHGCRGRDHSYL